MMPRPLGVSFTRRAATEIAAAVAWWARNRLAAPGAITDDINEAVGMLRAAPEIGIPVPSARLSGVRRIFLDRIDYHLYYRVNARRSRIAVLALWHARRRPPRL
jgi:plasmid stabilization system protein ParE